MIQFLRERLAHLRQAYAPDEMRPLDGYLITLAAYSAVVAGLATAARLTGRRMPERPAGGDVVLVAIATHKLSRMLAKDTITSPLRAPFTRYEHPAGNSEVAEEVRGEGGTRHALGELVSCPFCIGVWIATLFTGGLVLAPRLTRLVATAATAVAGSDFLQMAYAMASQAAKSGPMWEHPGGGAKKPATSGSAAG